MDDTTTPPTNGRKPFTKLTQEQYFAFRTLAEKEADAYRDLTANQLATVASDVLGFKVPNASAGELRRTLGWTEKPAEPNEIESLKARVTDLESLVQGLTKTVADLSPPKTPELFGR